jgi:hypothetical protein
MLYDIVPVVSFKGWPAVAQSWLMENHFWDGKITEEEVISGFYLLPASSFKGRKENEWRLSFARSEVQLKKCISSSLMQAYQACKALIIQLLSRPKAVSPYLLRSLMLWACDRLPASYLSSPETDTPGRLLLGLLDDLAHCILGKNCPNYFLPQCNMLEHLSDGQALLLARKLGHVRSDPAEHLRSTIEHAKAANRLSSELQWRGGGSNPPSPQSDAGGESQPMRVHLSNVAVTLTVGGEAGAVHRGSARRMCQWDFPEVRLYLVLSVCLYLLVLDWYSKLVVALGMHRSLNI